MLSFYLFILMQCLCSIPFAVKGVCYLNVSGDAPLVVHAVFSLHFPSELQPVWVDV